MKRSICPICGSDGYCRCGEMSSGRVRELDGIARRVRLEIFKFKTAAGVGHLASCLSCVDILVSLVFDGPGLLSGDDRILFSKGHGSPAIYPILVEVGLVGREELGKYCQVGGGLRLHSDASIPGCHFVGGSLGNGIGYAAGRAMAERKHRWYVIMGDAELYEGSVWEALMFLRQHELGNVTVIVDRNGMGILGKTEELLRLEPLADKFRAFGFETVLTVDGHDFDHLRWGLGREAAGPKIIIANTVKGKGVSYMEGRYEWHSVIPKDKQQIADGIKELS